MTAAEVLIKIRTFFEGSGSQQADASLKKTEAQAAKTGQQVSQAGQKGADGLNVMSVATAAMQGNFQAAANAAVPLLEKTKAVGLSMTQLSLAGALLSAVVAGLRAMSEWADAAAQRIAKIQMDNLTNKVNASAAAYDKLLESMQKASAQNDATLAYNNAMVDAYTRQALALNELAKQRELATTTDEFTRQDIEARYSAKGAVISGMADTQKEAMDRQRSAEKEAELLRQLDESKNRERELIAEAQALSSQTQNASSTARDSIGFMGFLLGGKKAKFDSYQGMAAQGSASTQEAIDKAKAETSRREQLELDRIELLRMRNVSGLNSSTGSFSRSAADMAADTSKSDRQRANTKAMFSAGDQLDSEMADFHPADREQVVSALRSLKAEGKLTVEAISQWTDYLRQIKDAVNRQRNF